LPYLFGLQVWKSLNQRQVSQEAVLGVAEIAFVVAALLVCLLGVARCRRANPMTSIFT
jgi:hypothetical protein